MISTNRPTQVRTHHVVAVALAIALAIALGGSATAVTQSPKAGAVKAPDKPTTKITLTTKPNPPVGGDNDFSVMVAGPDGKPIVGAEVVVTLVMPAMPSMNMAEMKNTIALKAAEGKDAMPGRYVGRGQVPMAGTWNVAISVKVGGKDSAEQKLSLTAK